MRTVLLSILLVFTACGASAGDSSDDDTGDDDAGGGTPDPASDACTPGARACFGSEVGICNATGTAWLYESSCLDTCHAGLCTGACIPGATRCHADAVETCDAAGDAWEATASCAAGCESGQCALDMLDVTTDTTLDGTVIVHGAVNVFAGATLSAPSGFLSIRATSITVDAGGAIVVAPVGQGTAGRGGDSAECWGQYGQSLAAGGGGGHATRGYDGMAKGSTCGGFGGSEFGEPHDLSGEPGGPGGAGYGLTTHAAGGGVMRLYAPAIAIAGELHADGANGTPGSYYDSGGAGAGGSLVLAGDQLAVPGTPSASGGGLGYVKLLAATGATDAMPVGMSVPSVAPPLDARSLTFPEASRWYNDDVQGAVVSWSVPFASRQGTFWTVDTAPTAPPTAATGTLAPGEIISLPALVEGDNYVHLVSIDAASNVGTVEATVAIHLNATPPQLSSQSHPSQTAWNASHNPLVAWTFPHDDASYRGVYYALDHDGDTVPGPSDTFVPVTQKQLLRAGLANGIWALHVISVDTAGRRTKVAAHYQLRIGPDPGSGRALGHVTGPSGPLANATVRFNRGLLPDQHTNSGGIYDLTGIPAGTWEVTASAPGMQPLTQTVAVAANGQITTDFALVP